MVVTPDGLKCPLIEGALPCAWWPAAAYVPGVKSKYTAKMTAPSPLTVLMSAVPEGEPKEVDGKRCFYFTQTPVEATIGYDLVRSGLYLF